MELINTVYEYGYAIQMLVVMCFGLALFVSKFKQFRK